LRFAGILVSRPSLVKFTLRGFERFAALYFEALLREFKAREVLRGFLFVPWK